MPAWGRSSFSYMLRIVDETMVSVGRIFEELVALSIVCATMELLMSLFFERLYTPGVENPETPFSREPSRELDATPSLKKPLVLVPKAGVSTSFFL